MKAAMELQLGPSKEGCRDETDEWIIEALYKFKAMHLTARAIRNIIEKNNGEEVTEKRISAHIEKHLRTRIESTATAKKKYRLL